MKPDRFLKRCTTVELTSADVKTAMMAIRFMNLTTLDVETIDTLTIRFRVDSNALVELRELCEKRGDSLKVITKDGWNLSLKTIKTRPILMIGLSLLLVISLWLPGRVLFIQVEGNQEVPARLIVEKASECGLWFGVPRRKVRSEKIKNLLLESIPQLSWVGVNTYGCTAIVTVREEIAVTEKNNQSVSSIVASRDGYILSLTVTHGNALCKVGQTVKEGQVLISGYTDCGISILATNAKGEVFAETRHHISARFPTAVSKRSKQTGIKRNFSVIIGKKRINFANSSGILDTGCAKIYKENYVTLPGGFVLPVAIAVETLTYYETNEMLLSGSQEILSDYVANYLSSRLCAGEILQAEQTIAECDGYLQFIGDYCCYEMIGVTRIEENIPDYVKND